jgi:PAS domain S-box-containing protein
LKKTDGENPLDVAAKPAFQTLAVNIPGIVYRVHVRERNRMEFFNPMLEQMTGYKAEELTLGEVCSIDPMIIPEDHLHVLEVVKGALRENKPFEIEYRITDKNGGIRYFLERGQPICGTDGKPEFIDGVILDITERKCSEIALLFKENIINSSSSVIATCDLEGSMTYGNPSFLKKWGFNDPKEFVGRPFWEFWLVKNRLDEIMQALRDDGHCFGEIKARRKDGGIQDFAFVASHDLAEPLRKVETFGKMLADRCVGGTFDEVSKDYLRRMKSAAERMKGLLDSLLMYSRVTTRAEPLKKTDLNKSIEEALSNLEMVIRAKNAEVEICDLPTVDADRAQMIQLFQNLIGNALKFSRKGKPPHVKIYSQEVGDAFEIHVKDNGIGFEEKYLEKIFLPFQRLHGRSSEYGGEGMGLAICKKIIERHGAEITARSSTGSGSTFIIRLPSKRCPWTATPCSEHCDSQQEEKP